MSNIIDIFTGKQVSAVGGGTPPAVNNRRCRYAALPAHIVRDTFLNSEFTRLQDEGFEVHQFEGRIILAHAEYGYPLSFTEALNISATRKAGVA